MGDNVVIGIQGCSPPSGSADSMGAWFLLSTIVCLVLALTFILSPTNLRDHPFVVGFQWVNIYKTSAWWIKGQRWKVGIACSRNQRQVQFWVIWFWIDVVAWNKLSQRLFVHVCFLHTCLNFCYFQTADLVRQGDTITADICFNNLLAYFKFARKFACCANLLTHPNMQNYHILTKCRTIRPLCISVLSG